jgi:hypothetical protein
LEDADGGDKIGDIDCKNDKEYEVPRNLPHKNIEAEEEASDEDYHP